MDVKSFSPIQDGVTYIDTNSVDFTGTEYFFSDTNSRLYCLITRRNGDDSDYSCLVYLRLEGYNNGTDYDYRINLSDYIFQPNFNINVTEVNEFYSFNIPNNNCEFNIMFDIEDFMHPDSAFVQYVNTYSNGYKYITGEEKQNADDYCYDYLSLNVINNKMSLPNLHYSTELHCNSLFMIGFGPYSYVINMLFVVPNVYKSTEYEFLCSLLGTEVFTVYSYIENDTLRTGVTYYDSEGSKYYDVDNFYANPQGIINPFGGFIGTNGVYWELGTCTSGTCSDISGITLVDAGGPADYYSTIIDGGSVSDTYPCIIDPTCGDLEFVFGGTDIAIVPYTFNQTGSADISNVNYNMFFWFNDGDYVDDYFYNNWLLNQSGYTIITSIYDDNCTLVKEINSFMYEPIWYYTIQNYTMSYYLSGATFITGQTYHLKMVGM